MKLAGSAVACALALVLCHGGAQASTAKSYASIYDFSFSFTDPASSSFVSDGPESTYVQAFNGQDIVFTGAAQLFASLEAVSELSNATGTTKATASSGANFLRADGFTNMQLGLYGSDAGYNSNSTQGGIIRLAAKSEVTLTGYYDLKTELLGPYCDSFSVCSTAGAAISFELGDDRKEERLDVEGGSGPTMRNRLGQYFSLDFKNDYDYVIEIFFSLSVSIFGSTPDVIDDSPGGGDGSPGGGGKVPEPSTFLLLGLALLALRLASRRRAASVPGAVFRPLAA